jgi:small conductance mechanosensitive channel
MLRSSTRSSASRWLAALAATSVLAFSDPLAAAPPPTSEPPPPPISLESGPKTDRAIAERLTTIYAQLDQLEGVEVEVEAGVVHLRGRVLSLAAANEAKAIASRVDGVVAVVEEVEQESQVRRRLRPVIEDVWTRLLGWLSYLPLLVVAVGVVALAWWLSHRLARRSQQRIHSSTFVRTLLGQIFRAGIVAIGIAIALELLGATGLLGALLGTAGIIGVALGLALKSTGENYFASILLSLRQPFDPHDLVKIDDEDGAVVRLTSRATVLLNLDGNHVRIPNSKVFNATITNYTRNPQRRFWFTVGVALDTDLRAAQELAVATLASIPGVLTQPGPTCLVEKFGESAMILAVAGWIDQRNTDWLKASSEAKRLLKLAFDHAGIDIPEPIHRVQMAHYQPRAPATAEPRISAAETSANVSLDDHLERQVDQERAAASHHDLLRKDGQQE